MIKSTYLNILNTLFLLLIFNFHSIAIANEEPDIKDIVVCNVYWEDYYYTSLPQPEAGKFVVTFDTIKPVDIRSIDSITVKGPNNYSRMFDLQAFNLSNISGYMKEADGTIWFQTYDRNGFLENGYYTITLTYKSGRKSTKSRELLFTNKLLTNFKKLQQTFTPVGPIALDRNKNISMQWKTIPGIDAYYATRLMKLTPNEPTKVSPPIFFDNIFAYGEGNKKNTGLNKSSVSAPLELDTSQQYVWFNEILDSNRFADINLAIFQRAQFFWFGNTNSEIKSNDEP